MHAMWMPLCGALVELLPDYSHAAQQVGFFAHLTRNTMHPNHLLYRTVNETDDNVSNMHIANMTDFHDSFTRFLSGARDFEESAPVRELSKYRLGNDGKVETKPPS